ncbi:hypothetical protein ANCCAN_02735 [Ancylostoma caninum]|uniref:Uncharacterized protein n=1 Tax=Ancylostoma caninum TaxID=29170 RepID=A0A368H799_ANCCA|nr:hypothetical protein ANCCAN_02735 [Ancylostoma caninum]
MKLLLVVLLLITPLYVRSHPVDSEHGDNHHTNNHISEKSGEEEPSESPDHHHSADHEPDPDIDPLDEEMPEDFRLEELNAEEECEDKEAKGDEHNEEQGPEEKKEHKKPSLKDHSPGEHKIGKRSIKLDHGHAHRISDKHREHPVREKRSDSGGSNEEEPRRVRRSKEGEEDKTEELGHHEIHGHAERKRRDTHEQHVINKRSSSEESHHPFKRSSGHRAPGGHEHTVYKRNADEVAPSEAEEPEEPVFASDVIEQVDSVGTIMIAVRMKRVSRAGSSHKPRVMHKNKGNSRAGQTDTPVEPE